MKDKMKTYAGGGRIPARSAHKLPRLPRRHYAGPAVVCDTLYADVCAPDVECNQSFECSVK